MDRQLGGRGALPRERQPIPQPVGTSEADWSVHVAVRNRNSIRQKEVLALSDGY